MKHLGAVVVAFFAVGCGDDGGSEPAFDAAPIPVDAEAITPCTSTGGPGGTHKLFLNFESQDLTPGAHDATLNTTPLITDAGTSPPWFDGAGTRDTLIMRVTDGVTSVLAPFDVEVTTTRPAAGPYTMMIMGGSPADLGLSGNFGSLAANTCVPGMENMTHLIFDQGINPAIQTVVAAFAMGNGISTSATHGSCLCWGDPACEPRDALCTLDADNDVALGTTEFDNKCEPVGMTTMNEHQKFKQAFGCRP
jgi:hypothetical protein